MAIRKSSTSGVPFGNTANRPANPTVGQTYYNGELGYQEIYTNAGWIPAAGGNDFNLNITSAYTTVTFSQSFAGGSYSIVSSSNDSTIDIYAYAGDGSLAGYTATKAFTATQRFNKMVVIGGTAGDVLSFSYKTTFATSATTSEITAGPFITAVSPSAMPNVNDTITITGGNFANDVQVAFTGSGYSSTQAKNIVRSSASSLIVTRPDNFPPSASPYTITITNPGVSAPAATLANISSNSITAGVGPVWNTASTLPNFTKGVAYSTIISASDADTGGSIVYSVVSDSLPAGISFNTSTGLISGTATVLTNGSINVRATDAGGNFVDRTFTIQNIGASAPVWVTSAGALPSVNFGNSYSQQLQATDDSGAAPTYSVVSGTLPSGLSLSSSGLISGTVSSVGTSNFTIAATDANGTQTSRSFSISSIAVIDYIVVAGGGGGGGSQAIPNNRQAGGGGAGGYRTSQGTSGGNSSAETPISFSTGTNYSVTIGAGGGVGGTGPGGQGGNSVFHTITSLGGGSGGASAGAGSAGSGGSGGGGGSSNYGGGSGTAGQGFAGGQGGSSNAGGGGGGAGGAGATGDGGSAPGTGITNPMTGGVEYARGGYGASGNFSNGYGFGGCGSYEGANGDGGKAGVVILRYPGTANISFNGVSGSTTTSGVFKITTITSGSGSVSFS